MRTIAIVGFSPKSNKAAFSLSDDVEIWTMNEGHSKGFRIDRLFEIHSPELLKDEKMKDESYDRHIDFLRHNGKTPVYMQEVIKEYPTSVKYPLEQAIKTADGHKGFSSTFDYMAAMAIMEAVDRVEIYGMEMDYYSTEYRYQKLTALYWIGKMEGAGIDVFIDENSTLFQDRKLYGYERAQMIARHTIDVQIKMYEEQREKHIKNMNMWIGVYKERKESKNGNVGEASRFVKQYEIQAAMASAVIEVLNHLIETCDLDED